MRKRALDVMLIQCIIESKLIKSVGKPYKLRVRHDNSKPFSGFWLAITCIHWTFAIDHTCRLLFSVRHILAMCSFRQTKFYIVDVCREYLDRNVQTTECPFIGFTQIQMENAKSSIKCSYKCNRWLSKSEEDHQIIRELPAIIQGKEPLPGNGQLTQEFVKLSVCVCSSMQWRTFGRLGLFEKWIALSTGSITI